MCASTRFPEAISLGNIKAKTIIKTLTFLFQQVRHELNIKQFKSNAYHPDILLRSSGKISQDLNKI